MHDYVKTYGNTYARATITNKGHQSIRSLSLTWRQGENDGK